MNFNNYTDLFRKKKTPFFFYDLNILNKTISSIKEQSKKYDFIIHYALKANSNKRILKIISEAGFGADCVSGNEIIRAIECGFPTDSIVFAGVGKSDEEINIGLDNCISCFNIESLQEVEVINSLALKKEVIANIAIRINPDVDGKSHKYITTGVKESKFGINISDFEDAITLITSLKNINLIGLHFHIGSQITDLNIFKKLCLRINKIHKWYSDRDIKVESINVGGGLGVNYMDTKNLMADFDNYFKIFKNNLQLQSGQKLHFELGRSITAYCGTLISRVLFIKKGVNIDFVILDAGITELIRPALYQSIHKIENISKGNSNNKEYNVAGPICESTDFFGEKVELPETHRDDLIAIRAVGAYGEVMASEYNLRSKAKAYYSDEQFFNKVFE